jgi:hypothetical protein
MVSQQLQKKTGKLTLHCLDSPLVLHKALQEQGIAGKAATLSCTYVPASMLHGHEWPTVVGHQKEMSSEGETWTAGANTNLDHLDHLPKSLVSAT